MNRLQWFIDRIGKRVFRSANGCDCVICNRVFEVGIVIEDEMHANYLCGMEGDLKAEGGTMRYFDSKEEVIQAI